MPAIGRYRLVAVGLSVFLSAVNQGLADSPASPAAIGSAESTLPPAALVFLSPDDRDALGRVAYAEAGNQGVKGIAAVVYTILNRVASGKFQDDVQAVVSAAGQFEPVDRAGSWRRLSSLSSAKQQEFDKILGGILSGQVPDPTAGALYFQNSRIVAARVAAGLVPATLIDFGGQPAIAQIGEHRFYRDIGHGPPGRHGSLGRRQAAAFGWGFVLGAFPQEFRALRAVDLAKASLGLPKDMGQPAAVLLNDGKFYAALLVGLQENIASTSCLSLRKKGAYCARLTPFDLSDPRAGWRS